MISRMMQIVNTTDSLYLTPAQQKDVLEYARSQPARFAACREVQSAEAEIVAAAKQAFFDQHPSLQDISENGWENFEDDQRLALRTLIQAMLLDDTQLPEKKHFRSLRRTLGYFDISPSVQNDWFSSLRLAMERRLSPDSVGILAPYFETFTARSNAEMSR